MLIKIMNYTFCFVLVILVIFTPASMLNEKNSVLLNLGIFLTGLMFLNILLNYWCIGTKYDKFFLEELQGYAVEDFGLFNLSVFSDNTLIEMKISRAIFYASCILRIKLNMRPRSLVQEKLFNNQKFKDNITPWLVFLSCSLPVLLGLVGILGVLSMMFN